MTGIAFVVGAIVVLVVAFIYGPRLAELFARNQAIEKCQELRARLQAVRIEGGNVVLAEQLQQQLAACTAEAARFGADSSQAEISLLNCDATYQQLEQQYRAFKSTDYADVAKRGNQMNAMFSMGSSLVACYEQTMAEADAESIILGPAAYTALLEKIRGSILRSLMASEERVFCYRSGSAGCDRYLGSVEGDGQTKGTVEEERTRNPLKLLLNRINEQITNLLLAARQRRLPTPEEQAVITRAVAGQDLVGAGLTLGFV